jgi:hypothetical protein
MRLCLILVMLVLWAPSPGESEPELTVDEIVDRHLEALGGSEKIGAIKSLEKVGTYVYNGMEHPIVSYHKVGRKCREEIEGLKLWGTAVWKGHTVVRGTNGAVAWVKDESRPPEYQTIPAARALLILEEADLHGAFYDYLGKGNRVELIGRGEVDGTPAYLLKLTLASGVVQTWYLDRESFLVIRKEVAGEEEERDLERPRAWHYDDYRLVDDVLMPFWVYVEEPLFAREYIYDTIEANVTLDDAIFEPPPGSFKSGESKKR